MFIRVTILFFLILHISIFGKCQSNFELKDAKEFFLPFLKESFNSEERIPFKEIIIKDYRYDSTKYGYIGNYDVGKVVIHESSSEYLTSKINYYFRNNLTPGSDKKLLIIIKTLWLQENALSLTGISDKKIRVQIQDDPGKKTGACLADFEIFSNNGKLYQPLIKIKENFYYRPYTQGKLWDFLLMPFDSVFNQLVKMDITSILAKRKSFALKEVDSGYINRFNFPVLLNPLFQKGVYLTFEDFKTNKITYTDFEVKRSSLTDELYIKTEKGDQLLTDFWGYCDGKDYFINSGMNLFKMLRQNNTWDIFGNTYISNKSRENNLSTDYGNFKYGTSRNKVELRPLQLNMETGKVY